MSALLYRLTDVGYAYPPGPAPLALEIDRLDVPEGQILALVGPNGAGKTTLLMLLAVLVKPTRGRIDLRGADPWLSESAASSARREAVLVAHHPYLFRGTIAGNVAFGLRLRKVPEAEIRARVGSALALVELDGWGERPAAGLSAGQSQRVALARALAVRPRVLLLDEPTANLDASLGLRMEAVLREARHDLGTTIVFSTHNFSQASRLADSILYLSEGRRVEFSHENCFAGTTLTDGRASWIEPKPGLRIVFEGAARGHVTCVIDPAAIRLEAAAGEGSPARPGPNAFRGRVSRMETTDAATALVRVSGGLVFRVTVPVDTLKAGGISLSTEVLITFDPASVRVVSERSAEVPQIP